MKSKCFLPHFLSLSLLFTCAISQAQQSSVIVGKNDWLFSKYAMVQEQHDAEVLASIELIKKANQILKKSNVKLVVITVPLKMDLYRDFLPDGFEFNQYIKGFNDATLARLAESGVAAIDLKKAMQLAIQNEPQNLLYYKLDSHWTHTGTFLAAQTVQQGFSSDPSLKKVYDAMPSVSFSMEWDKKLLVQSKIRDLANSLPSNVSAYPPERTKKFTVTKGSDGAPTSSGADTSASEVVLAGSSNSGDWLSFPDALRYTLQRNISNFSINADAGPWGVLRGYLQSDHFQTKRPSVVIWEIPGQAFQVGPNAPWRLERYKTDPQLWLLQVAALTESTCQPVPVKAQVKANGSGVPGSETGDKKKNAIEIDFDKQLDSSMYLRANLALGSVRQISVETWNKQKMLTRMNVDVGGDSDSQIVKFPIGVKIKDANQLKIFGVSAIRDFEVCRLSS